MTPYQLGILLALATAAAWTCSSLSFSQASQRIGSVPVNLIRLVLALFMLTAVTTLARGQALPTDATPHQLTWLAISGVVGFFIGDLTLFRAFILIGPRRATLLMSLAPAFAAIAGWLAFGERLDIAQSLGIAVTLVGVTWVIAERSATAAREGEAPAEPRASEASGSARQEFRPPAPVPLDYEKPSAGGVSRWGITLGFLAALGQGVGAVMTKYAFRDGSFDPFASTQIRAAAAVPLFALFILFTGRTRETIRALGNGPAMGFLTLGAIAGPFLGVSMFNASVARVPSGVTSMLAGMVPVFMLPIASFVQHERITPRAIVGAIVAVAGVALLALGD